MPYCTLCGVKLDHRYTNCPLCSLSLEYSSERESMPPLYPDVVNKISIIKSQVNAKDWIAIHLVGFITFLVFLLTTGLDIYLNNSLSWSLITTLSVVLVYFSLTISLNLKNNPIILYIYINILLGLYLYVLDIITTGNSWFIKFALPCFISLQLISLITRILFRFIKSKLFRAFIIIVLTNIFLVIINQITTKNIVWAVITSSVLIPTALYLLFIKLNIYSLNKKS